MIQWFGEYFIYVSVFVCLSKGNHGGLCHVNVMLVSRAVAGIGSIFVT